MLHIGECYKLLMSIYNFFCLIQLSEVRDLEDEAGVAFAKMDMFEGKTDDAILALEAINSVDSYWHLASVCMCIVYATPSHV